MNAVTIKEFITINYDIVYQSPDLDSIEDAQAYLICDVHQIEDVEQINRVFIETFAPPNSLVLVEAHKSGERVDPKRCRQTYLIQREDLKFRGWDTYSNKEGIEEFIKGLPESEQAEVSLYLDLLSAIKDRKRMLQKKGVSAEERERLNQEISVLEGFLYVVNEPVQNTMDSFWSSLSPRQLSFQQVCLKALHYEQKPLFVIAGAMHLDPRISIQVLDGLSLSLKQAEEGLEEKKVVEGIREEIAANRDFIPFMMRSLEPLKAKKIVIIKSKKFPKDLEELRMRLQKQEEKLDRTWVDPNKAPLGVKKALKEYYDRFVALNGLHASPYQPKPSQ